MRWFRRRVAIGRQYRAGDRLFDFDDAVSSILFAGRAKRDPVAGAFPDSGRKPVTAGRRKLTHLLE